MLLRINKLIVKEVVKCRNSSSVGGHDVMNKPQLFRFREMCTWGNDVAVVIVYNAAL